MKEIEKVWTQGPTHKLLGASRFEIVYRTRKNEWDPWEIKSIGSTATSQDEACRMTVGFLSKRHPNWTVQLVDCIDRGNEVEIQTGKPVEIVSPKDFIEVKRKAEEAWAEMERKEALERAKNKEFSK